MKKFLFVFTTLYCLIAVSTALAIDLGIGDAKRAAGKAGYAEATSETTFSETLGTVVKAALSFVGVIFLALMVYAGFLWLNSRGESEPVDKAKEIIKAAIIGLIITVGAYSITAFVVPKVLDRTAGPSGGDPRVGTEDPDQDGSCDYTRGGTGSFAGRTVHDGNMTRQQCAALCPGTEQNTECEFTPY